MQPLLPIEAVYVNIIIINGDPPPPVHADGRSWDTAVLLRLLHRQCKEVLEVFAPEAICLEDEREKYHLTTLRGWRAVL